MKKILASLLALLLVVSLLPGTADAAEVVFDGTCGENVFWALDTEGTLTITGEGETYDTPSDHAKPFDDIKDRIKKVIIGEGVTSIGERLFYYCTKLTSVTLPDSLTKIGYSAFCHCESLTELTIPGSVVSIDQYAFFHCESLTELIIPDSVSSIGYYAFSGCTSLTNVVLPEGITRIPYHLFEYCDDLRSVTIPSSVTKIDAGAFLGCLELYSIVLPDGLTHIESGAFANSGLRELVIPDTVSYIGGGAFAKCGGLTSIVIPDGVTSIEGSTFSGCVNLKSVTIPNSVTSIGASAFQGCYGGLKEIAIPDTVSDIGAYAFSDCNNLTSITIPNSVTYIGDGAFSRCDSLKEITFPASVSIIGDNILGTIKWDVKPPVLRFSWNAPEFSRNTFNTEIYKPTNITIFTELSKPITVYYPQGNPTWEDIVANNEQFGGERVTWVGEEYPCYHGETVYKNTKNPTCTESGYSGDLHCASCDELLIKGRVKPMEKHNLEVLPRVAATCTENGLTQGEHCTICGTVTKPQEVIEAQGHSWDSGHTTKYPTETEEGEITYSCLNCDETTTEAIAKLEHTHKYTDTVVKPTCTEPGYTNHVCACGHSYKDNETAALGHKWDEGKVTKEPTEAAEGEKAYTCQTCGETKTEAIAKLEHTHKYTDTVVKPTCTTPGYTTHTCTCGHSYKDSETKATGHSYKDKKCQTCGAADPAWDGITRLAGSHRFETAFLAANHMKQSLGIEKFDTVVVASGMDFADALSGSYLAAVYNAPILLACQVEKYNNEVKAYIQENLNQGGKIYILGGENAVPTSFETGLEGFHVKRLAGTNRFDTNLKVLEEAGVGDKPILVCTGLGFADSLSASATKLPILLVYGESLTTDQAAFLEIYRDKNLCILGGEGAVSEALETQLKTYGTVERLAGKTRFDTSVMIAEKFFENPDSAVLAYAWNFPDGLCGGPLAAAMNAPLILTMPKYEAQAASYVQSKNIQTGIILGGETLIPDSSVGLIFGLK